jgi:hypothetical protein
MLLCLLLVLFYVDGVLVYIFLVVADFRSQIAELIFGSGHTASQLKVDTPLAVGIHESNFGREARQALELML